MTKVQVLLAGLPDETKQQFIPLFGNVDKFYTVMYLIAKNEHITGNEKPDRYQERLDVIRRIRSKVENIVSSFGLDGTELVADVASDYFEDYVNFREPSVMLTNEEFVGTINKIAAFN